MVGYVLATRRPENAVGWLMVGMGVFFGLSAIVSSVGWYLLHTGRRDSGLVLLAIDSPSWVPVVVLPITFLLLLFPNGHLPSPRWRWFAWGVGVGLAIVYLAILLDPDEHPQLAGEIMQKFVNYRLRDWLFSRQRYWGEPFPIVYDETGLPSALPESIKVDAHMPEHRHGMNYAPALKPVGPGRWRLVARMRCESGKDGSTVEDPEMFTERIPYVETRDYVRKVGLKASRKPYWP